MQYYRSFMPHDFFPSLASSPLGVLAWVAVYFVNLGLCLLVMAACVFTVPQITQEEPLGYREASEQPDISQVQWLEGCEVLQRLGTSDEDRVVLYQTPEGERRVVRFATEPLLNRYHPDKDSDCALEGEIIEMKTLRGTIRVAVRGQGIDYYEGSLMERNFLGTWLHQNETVHLGMYMTAAFILLCVEVTIYDMLRKIFRR